MTSTKCCLFIILLILTFTIPLDCMRIAIFQPGTSKSHIAFAHNLAHDLKRLNHDIFVWSPILKKLEKEKRLTLREDGISEHRIVFDIASLNKMQAHFYEELPLPAVAEMYERSWKRDLYTACFDQYNGDDNMQIIEEIRNKKFDLALVHSMDLCPMILADRMGINNVVFIMVGAYIMDNVQSMMAVPGTPSFIPQMLTSHGDKMTFSERVNNLLWVLLFKASNAHPLDWLRTMCSIHKSAPNYDYPNCWSDIMPRANGILLNSNTILDFPRPTLYNIMPIPKQVMQRSIDYVGDKWSTIINNSDKQGVILFSLGSLIEMEQMPKSMKMNFLAAFAHFSNYTVLWRYEGMFPEAGRHKHIHLSMWLPQKAILAHPKTKLFITHSGHGGLTEAIRHNMPTLMLPLFMEQYTNANRALRLGVFRKLDKTQLSQEGLIREMDSLLDASEAERQRRRCAKLSAMMADVPGDGPAGWRRRFGHALATFTKGHVGRVHGRSGMLNADGLAVPLCDAAVSLLVVAVVRALV